MATKGRAPSKAAPAGGLPASRSGRLGRERVDAIQRARIVRAIMEACIEHGVGNVTVAHVVAHAGVSRRTFYESFIDRDDCLLAAFDVGMASAAKYVLDAYNPDAGWAERIRRALTALLEFLDAERDVGWLLVVGSLGAGTAVLERRRRVLARITTIIDGGRLVSKVDSGATLLTAEGVVGSVFSVLHGRLSGEDPGQLVELANPLMGMIVLPYLGAAAARRELSRPITKTSARDLSASTNPLKDLEMRLTYRTVRVLTVVGDNPGSSNRMIGDASGTPDQGQVSKLLARLERLGIVENAGGASAPGAPNAWTLTKRGREVYSAIATW